MNGLDLDLSGLEKGFSNLLESKDVLATPVGMGAPMEFDLDEIEEDPNQPRQEFDEEALSELVESIRVDKVRVPISVKPKGPNGKYIINHGARRYRASIRAGKKTIPGFIDDSHDDYAQVVENIQRDNLTALEIAKFIEKRRKAGDKDKDIGVRLGKSKSFISQHAALLSWPPYVAALYEAGHCNDASTLYNLLQLDKKAPSKVEQFCQRNEPVARRDVTALQIAIENANEPAAQKSEKATSSDEQKLKASSDESQELNQKPATKTDKPTSHTRVEIMVTVEGRVGRLLLERKASPGHGWISYNGTAEEGEVLLSALRITSIVGQGA